MIIKTFTELDIITKYSDDVVLNFTRQDSTGTPVNNSSYTYTTQIQESAGGEVLKIYTTTGSSTGQWTLTIDDYLDELDPQKKYYYEITEMPTNQCLIEGFIIFENK
jgi:hypothetical protein